MPQEGVIVSWKWGGEEPTGDVVGVKTGETQITTKNGNKVARHGTRADPAVETISHSTGNTVRKKASDVTVEEKDVDIGSPKTAAPKRNQPDETKDTGDKATVPKKAKTEQLDLEKKIEEEGLTKYEQELVNDQVKNISKEDWQNPVTRRIPSQKDESTENDEAKAGSRKGTLPTSLNHA